MQPWLSKLRSACDPDVGRPRSPHSASMDQFKTDRDFWALLVPELYVTDLNRSLNFYVDLLGFKVKFVRPEEGFAYIEMGQAQIMLDQIGPAQNRRWETAPLEPPFGRGMNLQIEVTDSSVLAGRLQDAGTDLFRPLEEAWYRQDEIENGQRQFLVQDPDGYLLRFIQHLGTRPIAKGMP